MKCRYELEDKQLFLEITEEIDHSTSEELRRKIDNEITRFMPRKVIFDFCSVSFMDSAGIGMVIGRYKLIHMLGGTLEIVNVNKAVKKIFEMSGIVKIIPVSEQNVEQVG